MSIVPHTRLVVCAVAALLLVGAGPAHAVDPMPSGRNATIDGRPVPTGGGTFGIEGRSLTVDGRPFMIDGRPSTIEGKTIVIDGRTVVRNGVLVAKQAASLVFTIDLRWLGATAYRIERDITSPIERAVKTLPGVKDVHSTVVGSRAQTMVSFDATADASTTSAAIRNRLDQIKSRLPRTASQPLIAWQRETKAP